MSSPQSMFWLVSSLGLVLGILGQPIVIAQEEKPPASEVSSEAGIEDLDAAMELKTEAKDIDQRTKVIELIERAMKKGLSEGDLSLAKQLLATTALERAKLQLSEVVKSRVSEALARRVQKRVLDDLELAVKNDPTLGEAHLLIAKLQARIDPEQAMKALDAAIENLQGDREKRGEAYTVRALLRDNDDDRLSDLRSAMEELPESLEVQRAFFNLLREKKDFEAVYQEGKALLEKNAKNPIALQATISSLLALKRSEEAIQLLNERIDAQPDDEGLIALRGAVFLDLRKYEEAIADGTKLISLNSKIVEGYFLRAQAYLQRAEQSKSGPESEDLRLARRDIDSALDIRPNSEEGIRLRAVISGQQRRYDEAIQDTTLLAKNRPQETLWLEHLANLYQLDERPSMAVKIADQLIAMDKKNWRAYHVRGDAKLSMGDQASAVSDYKQALKMMKDAGEDRSGLLNNLAWLLATSPDDTLRDGEQSIELGKEACELTEYKRAHILSTLAAAYAEVGDFEEAIKWSSKAVELGADEDHEQLEQLKNELNAYKEGKPWREKQEVKEKKPPVIKPEEAVET